MPPTLAVFTGDKLKAFLKSQMHYNKLMQLNIRNKNEDIVADSEVQRWALGLIRMEWYIVVMIVQGETNKLVG